VTMLNLLGFCVQRTCFFHARREKKLCWTKIMSKSAISSWGPSGWTFLHTASYAYPDTPTLSERQNMFKFLWYFARVIPCAICRTDFVQYLEQKLPEFENTAAFKSKIQLVHFLIDAHNYVNAKLGKRQYTYNEIDHLYLLQQHNQIPIRVLMTALIILIVVVIICMSMLKRKPHNLTPHLTTL